MAPVLAAFPTLAVAFAAIVLQSIGYAAGTTTTAQDDGTTTMADSISTTAMTGDDSITTTVDADVASTTAMTVDGVTTTMMDSAPTTSTDGSHEVVGSAKVININYEQLMNNATLKTEFESVCKDEIASSASSPGSTVNSSHVALTLSQGSVVVDYVIAGLQTSTESASVQTALNTAIDDGSLFNNLANEINAIPGIDAVTEGTIFVESGGSTDADDDDKRSKHAKLVGFIFLVFAFLVLCCCCAAGVYCFACKNRKSEKGMAEP
jgi:hypothetical protein